MQGLERALDHERMMALSGKGDTEAMKLLLAANANVNQAPEVGV